MPAWVRRLLPRRRRRADAIADAVALATAAVRIAVKNLLIVRALRDRADYDDSWWLAAVAREFEVIAAESESDAARLETTRARTRRKHGRAVHPADFRSVDARLLGRRIRMLRIIAERLRAVAREEDAVRALLGEARQSALDEITTARHDPSPRAVRDPEDRAIGLTLLAQDLAILAEERGLTPADDSPSP